MLPLRSAVGVVKVHGLDPATGRWGYPLRQRWGLSVHQEMSPGLEARLAFTLSATGAYEEAAAVARKWGGTVDDSTLHALAQRLGARAEQQPQQRLETRAVERAPQRAASEPAVFMLDGWQARLRGPGWGKKKTRKNRVAWHEVRRGVVYLVEQAGGHRRRSGCAGRQRGGLLAGRTGRVRPAPALGSVAPGTGAGAV